jgi:transcriptional regulator with XRE-family HTH domain
VYEVRAWVFPNARNILYVRDLFRGKRGSLSRMNKKPTTKTKPTNVPQAPADWRSGFVAGGLSAERQAEIARKLGARMRDLRLERGMSLARLHQCGGLTPSQMSSIERGLVQVTMGTVNAVAQALGMPVFLVLLLPDEDPMSAVLEEIRQAYGGDWSRAAFVIAGSLGLDISKILKG